MDPRIHRRRVEVRREEGRRRFRVLIGVTAVTAVGLAGWAATGSSLLDLDQMVIEGAVHSGPDDIRFASGLHRGERMLDVDDSVVVRGVGTLPWVQSAMVSKRWPGTVRIRVVERQPVAFTVSQAGNAALVDLSGRILAWVDVPPPGLGALAGLPPAGPPGSTLGAEGTAALAVAVALPAELRARAAGVSPAGGGRGEVDIHLRTDGPDADGIVRLGPPDDLDRKFTAVRAVLAQVDLRNLAVIDVRRPDSPVLTRREVPSKVSTPRVG